MRKILNRLYRVFYNRIVFPVFNKTISIRKYDKLSPDIVISGFPRSANTYLTLFIKRRLNSINIDKNIVSHVHTIDIIRYSKERNIKCIVPIRKPEEAILSTYIYFQENKSIKLLVKWYIKFYRYIKKYYNYFIIIKYEDIINNTNLVVKKINENMDVEIPSVENIKDEKEKIFNIMENQSKNKIKRKEENHIRQVGYPIEEREKLKQYYITKVRNKIKKNNVINKLYNSIVNEIR